MMSFLPNAPSAKSGQLFTEEDWNETSTLEDEPYGLSKVGSNLSLQALMMQTAHGKGQSRQCSRGTAVHGQTVHCPSLASQQVGTAQRLWMAAFEMVVCPTACMHAGVPAAARQRMHAHLCRFPVEKYELIRLPGYGTGRLTSQW